MAVDLSFRFDLWHARLPKSPRDVGRVEACVLRSAPGERRIEEALEVQAGAGTTGDTWSTHDFDEDGNQVEIVYLDDLGINLKPARAMGMTTIKVLDQDQAILDLGEALGIRFEAA